MRNKLYELSNQWWWGVTLCGFMVLGIVLIVIGIMLIAAN